MKKEDRIGESRVEFFMGCVKGRERELKEEEEKEGGREKGKGKGERWKKGKERKRRNGFLVAIVKQPC